MNVIYDIFFHILMSNLCAHNVHNKTLSHVQKLILQSKLYKTEAVWANLICLFFLFIYLKKVSTQLLFGLSILKCLITINTFFS